MNQDRFSLIFLDAAFASVFGDPGIYSVTHCSTPSPNEHVRDVNNFNFFRACHLCQQRKLRCDGNMNECTRCKALKEQCVYKVTTAKVGRPSKSQKRCRKQNIASDTKAPRLTMQDSLLCQYRVLIEEPEKLINNLNYQITENPWRWKWSQAIHFPRSPAYSMCTNDVLGVIIEKMSALCVNEKIEKDYPQVVKEEARLFLSRDFMRKDLMKFLTAIQATVLINLWFRNFPFPTVLNRVALIQDYIKGQTHSVLYSSIFALALSLPETAFYHESLRKTLSSLFLEYAASSTQDKAYSSSSLINLQSFYILAVTLTYRGYLHSARGFLSRAWKMVFELRIHEQDNKDFDIELDPISREQRNFIWWAMYIFTTWSYAKLDFRFEQEIANATIRLPVMKETESVLYAYSRHYGSSSFILNEEAHEIRAFYNCAYLMTILSEILMHFNAISGLRSMKLQGNSSTMSIDATLLQLYASSLTLRLDNLIGTISPDMAFLNKAELLLYLLIIKIHSHFLKLEDSLIVSIDYPSLAECIASADEIVDIADTLLSDQNSKSFHSTMALGLNTSVCVYLIMTISGNAEQQRSALFGLHKILRILWNPLLLYQDSELINTIEEAFNCAIKNSSERLGSESFDTTSIDNSTTLVVIPTVKLSSIAISSLAQPQKFGSEYASMPKEVEIPCYTVVGPGSKRLPSLNSEFLSVEESCNWEEPQDHKEMDTVDSLVDERQTTFSSFVSNQNNCVLDNITALAGSPVISSSFSPSYKYEIAPENGNPDCPRKRLYEIYLGYSTPQKSAIECTERVKKRGWMSDDAINYFLERLWNKSGSIFIGTPFLRGLLTHDRLSSCQCGIPGGCRVTPTNIGSYNRAVVVNNKLGQNKHWNVYLFIRNLRIARCYCTVYPHSDASDYRLYADFLRDYLDWEIDDSWYFSSVAENSIKQVTSDDCGPYACMITLALTLGEDPAKICASPNLFRMYIYRVATTANLFGLPPLFPPMEPERKLLIFEHNDMPQPYKKIP
ncbi:uncharacterized protein VTP21DRAFT_4772 [Calcarisporiella thermophila]|uniref:uncharacterized protein n=1 Tax=Calcarisporiella thermophila TaxID=911321 RepID=UPI0037449A59